MSKILFAVGHGKSNSGGYDSGATSNGYQEFKIAREITKYAQEYYNENYNENCDIMNYNGNLSLKDRINLLQDDTYDLVAEIHLNSGGGFGTECYYHHESQRGKELAEEITKTISNDMGIKNRGAKIKLNSNGDDYFGIIRETKPSAILIETMFIDTSDVEKINSARGQKKCGKAIAKAVAKVRNVNDNNSDNGKGEYNVTKKYKNGSTNENVYADTEFKNKIGSLDKYEECECIDKVDGKYVVKYKVNGKEAYKVGFVEYSGGLS